MCRVLVIYKHSPRPYYFKTRGYPTAQALLRDFQEGLGHEIKRLCLYRQDRLIHIAI